MLAAGLLTFITLAGPALLMTAGSLAASKPLELRGKRAAVRSLRIVLSMAFPVLLLTLLYFDVGSGFLLATLGVFAAYIAVMVADFAWSKGTRRGQGAESQQY